MNKVFYWLLHPPTDGPKSTLILRLMAGGVFFWEVVARYAAAQMEKGHGRGTPVPGRVAGCVGCCSQLGSLRSRGFSPITRIRQNNNTKSERS